MRSERERYLRNRSKLRRLTRAQRLNCLRVQQAFIQDLMNNDELGPRLMIEYCYGSSQPTPLVPSLNLVEDLINETHLILKLANWSSVDLYTYDVSFNNGELTWEEIEVTDSYWLQEWERNQNYYQQT